MNELEKSLSDMQVELVAELRKKIASGKATPADLNVACKLLKDNDITCADPANPNLGALSGEVLKNILPLEPDPDAPTILQN